MLPFALLLLQTSRPVSKTDVAEFTKNDRLIGNLGGRKRPTPAVIKNLELLVKVVRGSKDVSERGLKTLLAPFDKAAKKDSNDDLADEYTWVSASVTTSKGRQLVSVSYGPASRLAVFGNKGERLAVPTELQLLVPYSGEPKALPDGSVVLVSDVVEAMGMRTESRVDFLAPTAAGYSLISTKRFTHTLEWQEPEVKGQSITCYGLDDPTSFGIASASALLFRRIQTFDVTAGQPKLTHQTMLDLEFRALDRWLYRAQRTAAPTASQKIGRRLIPKNGHVDEYKLSTLKNGKVQILLNGDLQATLVRKDGAWAVSEVREVNVGKVKER